ncbi:hypothetical protein C8R44DRAFT_754633 [Mycena epipterygia]|nr:hypothetical protein C8R44DRAFT_754633 [Mycena epipterygia]
MNLFGFRLDLNLREAPLASRIRGYMYVLRLDLFGNATDATFLSCQCSRVEARIIERGLAGINLKRVGTNCISASNEWTARSFDWEEAGKRGLYLAIASKCLPVSSKAARGFVNFSKESRTWPPTPAGWMRVGSIHVLHECGGSCEMWRPIRLDVSAQVLHPVCFCQHTSAAETRAGCDAMIIRVGGALAYRGRDWDVHALGHLAARIWAQSRVKDTISVRVQRGNSSQGQHALDWSRMRHTPAYTRSSGDDLVEEARWLAKRKNHLRAEGHGQRTRPARKRLGQPRTQFLLMSMAHEINIVVIWVAGGVGATEERAILGRIRAENLTPHT